ncbi:DUF5806 family protein [Halegenticoccus tardaugens]|uniref:DUF5806 family protein n=1 Tax=Halegenticoccus tardaugens TaxID=2071624 RepID=UPI00100A3D9C|nr:DUF5806 family protein [Halegenticoccus tardaugens]
MADDPATASDSAREAAEGEARGETTDGRRAEASDAREAGEESPDSTADDEPTATGGEATSTRGETPNGSSTDGVAFDAESDGTRSRDESDATDGASGDRDVPEDVRKYERFKKMDGAQYDRVNGFLRDRTYVTAREWAIARLCADFRTETGVEMTKIGENLPELVPFMTDTYTPQAVNQARSSFEGKVKKAGATFLYGAMCGFFTAEELDEMMYEVTEIAKFLLEVEGVDLTVDEELAAEERISSVMREVRQSSAQLRGEEVECPECGHVHEP